MFFNLIYKLLPGVQLKNPSVIFQQCVSDHDQPDNSSCDCNIIPVFLLRDALEDAGYDNASSDDHERAARQPAVRLPFIRQDLPSVV